MSALACSPVVIIWNIYLLLLIAVYLLLLWYYSRLAESKLDDLAVVLSNIGMAPNLVEL